MSKESSMVYPDGRPVGRYSAIGNDVLEKIADIELPRPARKVLDRIVRDTIGYSEKQSFTQEETRRVKTDISMERFKEKTGLTEVEIKSGLWSLENRNIIRREGDTITFNHHLEEWRG